MAKYILIFYPFFLLLTSIIQSITGSVGEKLRELKHNNVTKWVDFFSRADPVPSGPLQQDIPGVESREIHNFSSVTIDHTSYWKNIDQFISPLMMEINKAAGNTLLYSNHQLVNQIAKKRPKRIKVLVLLRWMNLLTVPIAAIGLRNELASIGQFIIHSVQDLPLLGSIVDLLMGFASGLESVVMGSSSGEGFGVIGIVAIALFIFIWYLMNKRFWHTWDGLYTRLLFNPDSRGDRNQRIIIGVLVIIFAVIPFLLATSTLIGANLQNLLYFMWYSVWTVPMLLIVIGFIILIASVIWEMIWKPIMTQFSKGRSY